MTFGLVSIPVNLFPAHRAERAPLRMLSADGVPLARRYYSPKTGRNLDPEDMVRGYETKKDKYIVVSDDELERLAPEKSRDIDVRRFVDLDAIPPIYFERSYFLTPAANTDKAYRLLAETMEKSRLVGIATFVMRGKEYLVAIIPDDGLLRAETLRFADELRSPADVGLPEKKSAPKASVRRFESMIGKKSQSQLPLTQLKKEETGRVLKLVQKKRKQGKDVIETEQAESQGGGEVVDLLEVLKKSLAGKRR